MSPVSSAAAPSTRARAGGLPDLVGLPDLGFVLARPERSKAPMQELDFARPDRSDRGEEVAFRLFDFRRHVSSILMSMSAKGSPSAKAVNAE